MSRIYQPPGQPFDPLYVDCIENSLTRQYVNLVGHSLGLNPIAAVTVVQNTLDTVKQIKIEFSGQLQGAAGTKLIRSDFGSHTVFDSGALALNNQDFLALGTIARITINQFLSNFLITYNPTSGSTITQQQKFRNIFTVASDMLQARDITFFHQVSNAADGVQLDTMFVSVL